MRNSQLSSLGVSGSLLLRAFTIQASPIIPRDVNATEVQGDVDPKFSQIRTAFQHYLTSGEELGSSLSININGTDVVNLWGGYADANKTKPWTENTLVNVYSTGKTLVSLAALTLVDKGLLDIHEKVATYWPEFGANGKHEIQVRHLLSHTSGLAAWESNMTVSDIYDPILAASRLASQPALWPNRSISGYHAVTYGFPIGELIRRVTNKTMKQYIVDEITTPLGPTADFSIGVPEKDWPRVAELVPPQTPIPPPIDDETSISYRAFANPPLPVELTATAGWRNAEIGASNGHASAKGLTRVLSTITLGGEVDRVRLLSPGTINLIFQQQANGTDLVLNEALTFGVGFGLVRNETAGLTAGAVPAPQGKERRVAYWGGLGGSVVVMDLDHGVTLGYVMNRMRSDLVGSEAFQNYTRTLYEIIESE